eukprot:scaffold4675_cov179-Ochromonas_danica.AAC.1
MQPCEIYDGVHGGYGSVGFRGEVEIVRGKISSGYLAQMAVTGEKLFTLENVLLTDGVGRCIAVNELDSREDLERTNVGEPITVRGELFGELVPISSAKSRSKRYSRILLRAVVVDYHLALEWRKNEKQYVPVFHVKSSVDGYWFKLIKPAKNYDKFPPDMNYFLSLYNWPAEEEDQIWRRISNFKILHRNGHLCRILDLYDTGGEVSYVVMGRLCPPPLEDDARRYCLLKVRIYPIRYSIDFGAEVKDPNAGLWLCDGSSAWYKLAAPALEVFKAIADEDFRVADEILKLYDALTRYDEDVTQEDNKTGLIYTNLSLEEIAKKIPTNHRSRCFDIKCIRENIQFVIDNLDNIVDFNKSKNLKKSLSYSEPKVVEPVIEPVIAKGRVASAATAVKDVPATKKRKAESSSNPSEPSVKRPAPQPPLKAPNRDGNDQAKQVNNFPYDRVSNPSQRSQAIPKRPRLENDSEEPIGGGSISGQRFTSSSNNGAPYDKHSRGESLPQPQGELCHYCRELSKSMKCSNEKHVDGQYLRGTVPYNPRSASQAINYNLCPICNSLRKSSRCQVFDHRDGHEMPKVASNYSSNSNTTYSMTQLIALGRSKSTPQENLKQRSTQALGVFAPQATVQPNRNQSANAQQSSSISAAPAPAPTPAPAPLVRREVPDASMTAVTSLRNQSANAQQSSSISTAAPAPAPLVRREVSDASMTAVTSLRNQSANAQQSSSISAAAPAPAPLVRREVSDASMTAVSSLRNQSANAQQSSSISAAAPAPAPLDQPTNNPSNPQPANQNRVRWGDETDANRLVTIYVYDQEDEL